MRARSPVARDDRWGAVRIAATRRMRDTLHSRLLEWRAGRPHVPGFGADWPTRLVARLDSPTIARRIAHGFAGTGATEVAAEPAAAQVVADLHRHPVRQLPARPVSLSGSERAADGSVHGVQAAGRRRQRRGNLQSGHEHRGAIQERGHVAAAEGDEACAGLETAAGRAAHRRHVHDGASGVRRSGPRAFPDRSQRRDQRGADSRRQHRRVAASRLRPGDPDHRVLRVDLPPRRAAGRRPRHGRSDGHRPQQGAPLRRDDRAARSRSTTSPASTKRRTSWSRSSTSSRRRRSTRGSAARRRRACCWSARRAPARRCSRARSPARRACRSSR